MASININRKLNDTFYRYKMPKIQIRRDGTKTILVNLAAIGNALRRPPKYIIKFFAYEYSISVRIDEKEDRYIISGNHNSETLQNTLDKFIQRYVLCSKCELPDTRLILSTRKNDELYKVCDACGYRDQDNMKSNKLTKYIAKDLQESADEILTNNNDDDINDYVLQSNELIKLIEIKKNENKLNDIDTIKDIIIQIEEFFEIENVLLIIGKYLFTENILKEINEYKLLFQQFCKNHHKNQRDLLYTLEILIHDNDNIRRAILHRKILEEIFYKFYDADIIEEEIFHYWYKNPSEYFIDKSIGKKIRQVAEGFIQWLNQSDTSDNEK